jgi:hypothetical protein
VGWGQIDYLDDIIAILGQLRLFYLRFNTEHQARLANLPKINRWNKKAWQKFFTEYLSKRFKEKRAQIVSLVISTASRHHV